LPKGEKWSAKCVWSGLIEKKLSKKKKKDNNKVFLENTFIN